MNNLLLGLPILGLLYAGALWYWIKRGKSKIPENYLRVLLWAHGVLVFLIIIALWLSHSYNIHFRGQSTNRVIIWAFLITGIATAFFSDKLQSSLIRLYFRVFSWLPVFICFFIFVPFIGPIATLSYWAQLTGKEDTVFYNTPGIRVQNTFIGVLGPPRIDVYSKKGLFEQRIYRENIEGYRIDSVRAECRGNETILYLYHTDTPAVTSPLQVKIPE